MSLVKKNIAANFAGSIWQGIMYLVFIPVYIRFMGVESYGLIGISMTLQAVLFLMDMGLSTTLNREMARLSVLPGKAQEMRDLVRSLEVIYWGLAVLMGSLIFILAPVISYHWVKPGVLSPSVIEQAIRFMGLALALQWPASFYSGGLMGLQQQVLLNFINSLMSTFRSVGAVLVLWLISPTIKMFFIWQIVSSIVATSLLAFFLWHKLPSAQKRPSFQAKLIRGVWRFAIGMSGITILGMILSQLDKIILSKMLTLEMFGYYSIAGVVAMSLYRLIMPVFSAVYPKFTQLVSLADGDGLKRLYHKSCQFVSVLIFPVAVVIALFSYDIMLFWTQSSVTASKTYLLVSLLICGTALNGLGYIPYALQSAYAWVKLGLYINSIFAIILVPLIIYMTKYFGAVGGASVWVILNLGYFFISIPLMHGRLLHHECGCWYRQDVGLPLAASLIIAGVGKLFLHDSTSQLVTIVYLVIIFVLTFVGTVFVTPTTRVWLFEKIFQGNHRMILRRQDE